MAGASVCAGPNRSRRRGAVGGGDQAGGDLRVAGEILGQLAEVLLAAAQTLAYGIAHIAEQRRTLAFLADTVEKSIETIDQQRRCGAQRSIGGR